jgi:hypothetical protein
MQNVCILLVLITYVHKHKQCYLTGNKQGHVRNSLPREKITQTYTIIVPTKCTSFY